jgi:hypothetical protein
MALKYNDDDLLYTVRQLDRARRENNRIKKINSKVVQSCNTQEDFLQSLREIVEKEKSFGTRGNFKQAVAKGATSKAETACFAVSDLHLTEKVSKIETNGINVFNTMIAANKLWQYVQSFKDVLDIQSKAFKIEKLVSFLLGDMISGTIHPEQVTTNELSDPAAVVLASRLLSIFYREIASFGIPLCIEAVHGNHPRMTPKMPTKKQAHTNLDWLIYEMLKSDLAKDGIELNIHTSQIGMTKIYKHNYIFEHGISVANGAEEAFEDKIRAMFDDPAYRAATGHTGASFDHIVIGNMHKPKFLERTIVNGCFLPGMLVTLDSGVRVPIEDVKLGDKVVCKGGGINKVVDLGRNHYSGGITRFRINGAYGEIACTDDHRIWAFKNNRRGSIQGSKFVADSTDRIDPDWIHAKYLSEGDYVQLPYPKFKGNDLDLDTCRFIGLYLAEGSASGANGKLHHIDFTFHESEEEYATFVEQYCINKWGRATKKLRVRKAPNGAIGKTWSVTCNCAEAAELMVKLCGKGAKNKCLDSSLMELTRECHAAILGGWVQGDGHILTGRVKDKGRKVTSTSISLRLAEQMFVISLRAGAVPTLTKLAAGGKRTNDAYTLNWYGESASRLSELTGESFNGVVKEPNNSGPIWVGDDVFVPIKLIGSDSFTGTVYNLSVENDHSYAVNGVGVANCFVGQNELGQSWRLKPITPKQLIWGVSPKRVRTWEYMLDLDTVKETVDNPIADYAYKFLRSI